MPFRVKQETWLKTEGDRLQSILLMPKYWRKTWTDVTLWSELHNMGLDYTIEEVQLLNDELHKRKVVEDIPESQPALVAELVPVAEPVVDSSLEPEPAPVTEPPPDEVIPGE